MEPYDALPSADPFSASTRAFQCLALALTIPEAGELSHHDLEAFLDVAGRDLLRQLFQDHLDLRAIREEAAAAMDSAKVTGADGWPRQHREPGHVRKLACLFGTVTVARLAWRNKGLTNVYPADAALSLPAHRHSMGLRRLAVLEAARSSFDQAGAAIERRCGKVLGKRQAGQLVAAAAVDIDVFYQRKIPLPATAATTLVISVDGKGIVMRPEALRPATLKAHQRKQPALRTRLAPGEKPHRKRMATLAAVYDTDPAPRRPHDVIAPPDGRSERREKRPGPKAKAKWLTGSVIHPPEHTIAAAFDQALARDPEHLRSWVVLVDGARHQLDLIQAEATRREIDLHILIDFVHVTEYVWRAAHCFHPAGTPAAESWVATHLTSILHGQADRVAAEITTQADHAQLTGTKREGVNACVRYLNSHIDHLRYDTALAAGWPIATGVIEGACRHLIADRLDITGARWGLTGAEALLKLRALIDNGDFDTYWAYHLRREHERLYPAPDQHRYQLTA
ncbi:ISKra4 family transposase [Streptomyces antarcticus]|uniref:ISKra4 family transposase n=1 Tax=Streptomyces antarcticus TaxID=2996458 RepID=UPI00227069B5|nr:MULTISPECIES: ISKra4 family transposase [unclassified Streptomyces]MCY0940203.1 ISKra4 family transposase [Streptomyces sp. H34-AA3]MCZ4080850.1 ISKra4 family transposase [Streptomyces sp. H34-S5]